MQAEATAILSSADCSGGVSEADVKRAEQRLGVEFPLELREFLKDFGAATGVGLDIAGVRKGDDASPPLWRDMVAETERLRKVTQNKLPHSLVLISDDGCGVKFYVDTVSNKTDCRVVAYGPNFDGIVVADSLSDFIVKRVNEDI
jgi:cell wall assembly regulator SMI1